MLATSFIKQAGHARPSTTWLYRQTDEDREKDQVNRIWKRLQGGALYDAKAEAGVQ